MTESWAVRVTTPDWALVMWNPSFSRCLDLEGEVGGGRPGSRGWERGEGEGKERMGERGGGGGRREARIERMGERGGGERGGGERGGGERGGGGGRREAGIERMGERGGGGGRREAGIERMGGGKEMDLNIPVTIIITKFCGDHNIHITVTLIPEQCGEQGGEGVRNYPLPTAVGQIVVLDQSLRLHRGLEQGQCGLDWGPHYCWVVVSVYNYVHYRMQYRMQYELRYL